MGGRDTKVEGRTLTPESDRIVLFTSSRSSRPVREHLQIGFRRLRTGHGSTPARTEVTALDALDNHVRRAWARHVGSPPSDDELMRLKQLTWIHTLDVDRGGADEGRAKDLLRTAVLRNAAQAESAWDVLTQAAATFASTRTGADRLGLQKVLTDAGIVLRETRSYRDDVARLQNYSQSTVATMADLSMISVGDTVVKLKRPASDALRTAAETESLLVVGDPGAGKTGSLVELVETLKEAGRDIVFLSAGHIDAETLGSLRNDLGLTHDLADVLLNWPGEGAGVLVVDALDAARSEASVETLRRLISQVTRDPGRWNVVASIRKFDLRAGQGFRSSFAGTPPSTFSDPEFSDVRHVNIAPLTEAEFAQIRPQSVELADLAETADPILRDLIKNPFNLRLLAELLGEGVSVAALTPIRTQLELLDRYWFHRVIKEDRNADAREAILRDASNRMVESRSLRVDRAQLASTETSLLIHDLLSAHVLSELQPAPGAAPNRYVLTFAHHVLFDYAVERLLLRGSPDASIERLRNDPELVLAIRPSLVFHFRHLWETDRAAFWELTFRSQEAPLPELGKLLGPSVIAEEVRTIRDLDPLIEALGQAEPGREPAERVLRHLVGSLLAQPDTPARLVGAAAGPWIDLLARATE